MSKDEWIEKVAALRNPVAQRIAAGFAAFNTGEGAPMTYEARRVMIAAVLGVTPEAVDGAHQALERAGLAVKQWLQ